MVDETIRFPQMADAFPFYDQDSLPEIPSEWTDVSWHQDACPSFNTNDGWIVWIDYVVPYDRERAKEYRFTAIGCDVNGVIVENKGSCATNNWEDLLKWL